MSKKMKSAVGVVALTLAVMPSAYAKKGTTCQTHDAYYNSSKPQKFACKSISEKEMTIDDIYNKNYQVVTSYRVNRMTIIVIEEQD